MSGCISSMAAERLSTTYQNIEKRNRKRTKKRKKRMKLEMRNNLRGDVEEKITGKSCQSTMVRVAVF